MQKLRPGQVRDGIELFLSAKENRGGATLAQISEFLDVHLGNEVARSSVRSYLNLNTPMRFERVGRGTYRLVGAPRG